MKKKNEIEETNKNLIDIESLLLCPNCSHRIEKRKEVFFCEGCGAIYPLVNNIPVLIKSLDKRKLMEARYHSSVSNIYKELHQLRSYRNIYYHLQSLKPILELGSNVRVLELGCGIGYDTTFLLKKGQTVVATDIAIGQVLEAKKELVKKGLVKNAHFYAADAERIPFADESFNATLITAALHHLEHPAKALSEMKRCTKKGGIIIIAMEPNRYEWLGIIGYGFTIFKKITFFLFGKKIFKKTLNRTENWREPNIERTFSKKEILDLIKEAGLYHEKIMGIWFTCGFIHWLITLFNKISTKNWYINRDIERFFLLLDEFLAKIPGINYFACNWTVWCRNRGMGVRSRKQYS